MAMKKARRPARVVFGYEGKGRRRVKREVRKAMERAGYSRRDCYTPIWWPK